ncbi:Alpha/Beta hydrolase protein [Gorgonomyces haynaldii]|nr:Alpha/Beta hydrolase protein [Gorgonomyces haynaldii]
MPQNLFSLAVKQAVVTPDRYIAYEDNQKTSSKTFVCIPGIGDFRQSYRFLIPALSKHYPDARFIAMDLRGHGDSSIFESYTLDEIVQDIKTVMDDAQVSKAVLLGNSLAGAVMIGFAALYPDRVESIINLNGICRKLPADGFMSAVSGLLFNSLWGVSMWTMYYQTLIKDHPPQDFKEYVQDMTKKVGERGRVNAIRQLVIQNKDPMFAKLKQVKSPILYLVGSKDPDFSDPKAEVEFYKSQTPTKTDAHVLEGVGHYVHVELPEQTASLIKEFL